MKKTIALFPGQGSQKIGMGKELTESSEIAQEYFNRAQSALGFDLATICFNGPEEKLTSTAIAQPAILTVSVICFEIARSSALQYDCAAGHSLGEYSALVASGAIKFDDAVALVHKRGRYMQDAVPVGTGKMVAVLGKEVSEIEAALSQISAGIAQIANDNAPGQIVVAGDNQGVEEFQKILAGAKMIELKVSAPFHCSLMKQAEDNLRKDLSAISITSPQFPVISNYFAKPLNSSEEIREALALQVCGRVRWVESMKYASEALKIERAIEFGSGNVLTGLLKRIQPEIERVNVSSTNDVPKDQ